MLFVVLDRSSTTGRETSAKDYILHFTRRWKRELIPRFCNEDAAASLFQKNIKGNTRR